MVLLIGSLVFFSYPKRSESFGFLVPAILSINVETLVAVVATVVLHSGIIYLAMQKNEEVELDNNMSVIGVQLNPMAPDGPGGGDTGTGSGTTDPPADPPPEPIGLTAVKIQMEPVPEEIVEAVAKEPAGVGNGICTGTDTANVFTWVNYPYTYEYVETSLENNRYKVQPSQWPKGQDNSYQVGWPRVNYENTYDTVGELKAFYKDAYTKGRYSNCRFRVVSTNKEVGTGGGDCGSLTFRIEGLLANGTNPMQLPNQRAPLSDFQSDAGYPDQLCHPSKDWESDIDEQTGETIYSVVSLNFNVPVTTYTPSISVLKSSNPPPDVYNCPDGMTYVEGYGCKIPQVENDDKEVTILQQERLQILPGETNPEQTTVIDNPEFKLPDDTDIPENLPVTSEQIQVEVYDKRYGPGIITVSKDENDQYTVKQVFSEVPSFRPGVGANGSFDSAEIELTQVIDGPSGATVSTSTKGWYPGSGSGISEGDNLGGVWVTGNGMGGPGGDIGTCPVGDTNCQQGIVPCAVGEVCEGDCPAGSPKYANLVCGPACPPGSAVSGETCNCTAPDTLYDQASNLCRCTQSDELVFNSTTELCECELEEFLFDDDPEVMACFGPAPAPYTLNLRGGSFGDLSQRISQAESEFFQAKNNLNQTANFSFGFILPSVSGQLPCFGPWSALGRTIQICLSDHENNISALPYVAPFIASLWAFAVVFRSGDSRRNSDG